MPRARLNSQMAWQMARTWSSLKLLRREEPRCPEVPNANSLRRVACIGPAGVVGGDQARHIDKQLSWNGLPCQFMCVHGSFLSPASLKRRTRTPANKAAERSVTCIILAAPTPTTGHPLCRLLAIICLAYDLSWIQGSRLVVADRQLLYVSRTPAQTLRRPPTARRIATRITAPTKATRMLVTLMPFTASGMCKKCGGEEAADHGAHYAHDDVADEAVATTAHDLAGQPTSNQPNDDPGKDTHCLTLPFSIPLIEIAPALFFEALSNFCRDLAISHLVNRFNTHDTASEFGALQPFFELALGLARAKDQDGSCIPDTLNRRRS